MTEETRRRIGQEIRLLRGILTADESWAQSYEKTEQRDEDFRYVNFWRKILKVAEQELARTT